MNQKLKFDWGWEENIVVNRENACHQHSLLFLQCFKGFLFNPLPNDKFIDWSKLKALADSRINVTEKVQFDLGMVENIMGKGENAGYQHFLLFP